MSFPRLFRAGWSVSSQALTVRQELESSGSFDILIGSSFGALAIANAVEGVELRPAIIGLDLAPGWLCIQIQPATQRYSIDLGSCPIPRDPGAPSA